MFFFFLIFMFLKQTLDFIGSINCFFNASSFMIIVQYIQSTILNNNIGDIYIYKIQIVKMSESSKQLRQVVDQLFC